MAYVKKTWENKPSTASPINANNLNHIEQGIYDNDVHVDNVDLSLQAIVLEVNDLKSNKMSKNNPIGTGYVQLGDNASANSQYGTPSFAIGRNAKATGINSYAIGESLEVINAEQVAIGRYNDTASNAQFMIGGGSDDNDRLNLLEFASNGDATFCAEITDGTGNTLSDKADMTDVINMLPVDNESGNPCVITDAFGGAVKSLKVTLEPIQASGTPSPSNPLPISGYTQAKITRTGKNLFGQPYSSSAGTSGGIKATINADGSVNFDGTPLTQYYFNYKSGTNVINLKAGTYTISNSGDAIPSNCSVYFMVGGQSNYINGGNPTRTFTLTTDSIFTAYMYINTSAGNVNFTPKIQLELGSTVTDYEPYNGVSITRTYGTTIYGGSDDVAGDGATSTYNLVNLSDLSWADQGTPNTYQATISDLIVPSNDIVCSHYPTTEATTSAANMPDKSIKTYGWSNLHTVIVKNSDYPTLASFTASLTGVQLAYPTTSPTSIPLTAQNITLLHGDNVLTTDADSIEASYSADIALYIAKKIAEGSQGNRSLSKGGTSEEEKKEEIEIKEAEPLTKEVR